MTTLFPACVLPGCDEPTVVFGDPCESCRDSLGPYLVRTAGPRPTPAQIAERDQEMAAAQRRMRLPERKANQLCWLCDERRSCTRQPSGWECDECQEIR